MNELKTLAAALALVLTVPAIASAQQDHGHAPQSLAQDAAAGDETPAQMGGDQTAMMRMMQEMMQMHAGMTARSMHLDSAGRPGMRMMDEQMMRMMMGPATMISPSAEDAASAMRARLSEYDADDSGSLSLAEFETLHAAVIRETTVDRFQHLDADGDGQITEAEMVAPARRMDMPGAASSGGDMMDSDPNANGN